MFPMKRRAAMVCKQVLVFGRVVGTECGRRARTGKGRTCQWPKTTCVKCLRKRDYSLRCRFK